MMFTLRQIRTFVTMSSLLFLVACYSVDVERAPPELRPELLRIDARYKAMEPNGKKNFRTLSSQSGTLTDFLRDTTVRSFDTLHGTQVEVLLADGRTLLWYPGNRMLVAGYWQVKSSFDGADICFKYGENTYNPVTRDGGGSWECSDASIYLMRAAEVVDGDPMRLASGRIPFVLSKENKSIASLAAKSGKSGVNPNKVDW